MLVLLQRIRPVTTLDSFVVRLERGKLEEENVSQLTPEAILAHWTIVRLHTLASKRITARVRKHALATVALRLVYARAEYLVAA
jgi:hypothetical protein